MARAVTSASALSELRNDLSQLSKTLHDVFDLMTADMSNIGQEWQDGQYEQFKEAYSKQIHKCEDISVRYNRWCTSILDTTIANVEAVEHTNVVSGGGNSLSGATTSSIGATAAEGVSGKAAAFNLGKQHTSNANGNESSGTLNQIDAFLNKKIPAARVKKTISRADQECEKQFGSGFHGIPSSQNEANVRWGSTSGNDKVSSGVDVDFMGVFKGKLGSEANSGTDTSEGWAKCVPNEE